jgi:hypothetical protein
MNSTTSNDVLVHNHTPIISSTSFPSWIRIFKANTSTSRRTQAAAMAYMIPAISNKNNNIALDLSSTTTARRQHIDNINIPLRFTVMAGKYQDEVTDNIAIVCDGGIDHDVPHSPPPSKVSQITSCIIIIFPIDL